MVNWPADHDLASADRGIRAHLADLHVAILRARTEQEIDLLLTLVRALEVATTELVDAAGRKEASFYPVAR